MNVVRARMLNIQVNSYPCYTAEFKGEADSVAESEVLRGALQLPAQPARQPPVAAHVARRHEGV